MVIVTAIILLDLWFSIIARPRLIGGRGIEERTAGIEAGKQWPRNLFRVSFVLTFDSAAIYIYIPLNKLARKSAPATNKALTDCDNLKSQCSRGTCKYYYSIF